VCDTFAHEHRVAALRIVEQHRQRVGFLIAASEMQVSPSRAAPVWVSAAGSTFTLRLTAVMLATEAG